MRHFHRGGMVGEKKQGAEEGGENIWGTAVEGFSD